MACSSSPNIVADTVQPEGTDTLSLQYLGLLETAYAPGANGTPVAVASQGLEPGLPTGADNTTTPPIGAGTTYAARRLGDAHAGDGRQPWPAGVLRPVPQL